MGINDFYNGTENGRSIFRAIKFFKEIESKVKEIREEADQSNEAVKQLEFMKGRVTELETLKRETNESLNLKDRSFMNT